MPFHWVSGDSGAKLRELRFDAIDRLVAVAAAENAQFILIAGDLFDANALDDRVVQQACVRFARSPVPIFVIPGNHDHIGEPNAILRRPVFRENRPDCLRILDNRDPVSILDGAVVLLPAPVFRRVERDDPTSHITAELGDDLPEGAVRVGIAHGSVIAVDPLAAGSIDSSRAKIGALDYLALGDWHGRKQIDDRTWYSGAPEPTAFKDRQTGDALLVDVAGRGAPPEVRPVPIGQTRWIRHDANFSGPDDLNALETWLHGVEEKPNCLVRLAVGGALPFADLARFDALCEQVRGQLLHLRIRGEVFAESTAEVLDALAVEGYLKMAVEELADRADGPDSEQAAVARRALRILYQLQTREGAC